MVKSKRVGNIIYRFDGNEFTIVLVDGKDETKRVNLSSMSTDQPELSISTIEFTQTLLEEAHAVLKELRF